MRFIEWELEQDPDILARFNTGKLIDAGALRHVICNVDPPEGVSFEDTMKVLNEVAEAVRLVPCKRWLVDRDEIIRFVESEIRTILPSGPPEVAPDRLAQSTYEAYIDGRNYALRLVKEKLEVKP